MTVRELIVLGTASQVPTRQRNHNGYLLRWDGEGLLFDPGDGSQRQLLRSGAAASDITRICITHFHGDHCLGVPGIVQRLSLDRVQHTVHAHYPQSGAHFFERLRYASAFYDAADIKEVPVVEDGEIANGKFGRLEAYALDHGIDSVGYRLVEPDGHRMLPEKLKEHGIQGPAVRTLQQQGEFNGVKLADVSEPRKGQRFAFVMDTRLCDNVFELADNADMLVIESTYLARDTKLAGDHGHLTAQQAARVARDCRVRKLVLTHFSQRYDDPAEFLAEAAAEFDGEIVIAKDLDRIPVPKRATGP
ncbi:ribonuclease Z [Lentzea albidocapillata subsp. violacea]|uniref:Ribonuclease Z n=1 Tax=Lentzea albidocapillata subsp. violacea TaxID=128104 RepID=A0A1G9DS58_9PSEU|nr:ribonuclease Z [Lentzea albidocapillata]SDK66688.1 ribonuclease Z [Lentzea albidocapillata subsp. violacea]